MIGVSAVILPVYVPGQRVTAIHGECFNKCARVKDTLPWIPLKIWPLSSNTVIPLSLPISGALLEGLLGEGFNGYDPTEVNAVAKHHPRQRQTPQNTTACPPPPYSLNVTP